MPIPDSRQAAGNPDLVKQIQSAWDEAQAQLAVLRDQVQHAAELAEAKVQSNVLSRELDKAYRALGEAVWAEISKGKLQLPSNLTAVRKALEVVTQKLQQQNASINDLLAEGADIAAKLQAKMSKPANPSKKR